MERRLWPAHEERTADDKRHVTTNRAHDRESRYDVRQRAQDTTNSKRAKDDNAGQPGTANAALPTRSQDVKRAKHYERKMLCRLTLKLSGGVAVRLERTVRRHRSTTFDGR